MFDISDNEIKFAVFRLSESKLFFTIYIKYKQIEQLNRNNIMMFLLTSKQQNLINTPVTIKYITYFDLL